MYIECYRMHVKIILLVLTHFDRIKWTQDFCLGEKSRQKVRTVSRSEKVIRVLITDSLALLTQSNLLTDFL